MNIDIHAIKIPPIPTVTIQVMLFDPSSPEASSYALEKLISPDKGICTDIMRVSNSSFYGRSGKVKNLKDAITLLGLKTVKNLVILQSSKNLRQSLKGEVFRKFLDELPLLTALVSLDLCGPTGMKAIREDIFLGSLLHKIGMTIMALNFRQDYLKVLEMADSGVDELINLEKATFQLNYVEVGYTVFKHWKFSNSLIKLITDQLFKIDQIQYVTHHDRIIRLSDLISKRLLGIFRTMEEVEMEKALFEYYKTDARTQEIFHDSYMDLIRSHPFFEMAAN